MTDAYSLRRWIPYCGLAITALVAAPFPVSAQTPAPPDPLKRLSIEELTRIDVTTVTRGAAPVRATAAAVSVITADDIRRAGVVTIADALRLATGVHVARVNNGIWAISTRGFNAPSANKVLVLVDGRNAYSPLFTGVFWNLLEYPLADVDRIEVIRGPGAALWGANAANGVVNIVTRSARATPGGQVSLGSGVETPATATVRYGGSAGPTAYRLWGTFHQRAPQQLRDGTSADDRRRTGAAGFRVDREGTASSWWLAGSLFRSHQRFSDLDDGEFGEAALHANWTRVHGPASRVQVQSYYRRESRDVPRQLSHHVDTGDVDLQHEITWGSRHALVWGGGVRVNTDDSAGGTVAFDPPSRTYPVWNVFAQDEYSLVAQRLFLTGGVKLEHNAFSGAEWHPTVRLRFTNDRHTVWTAVSRAMRRPARLDADLLNFTPSGALVAVGGGDRFRAEELIGLDGGYRAQIGDRVTAEIVGFDYRYDDLRSAEPTGQISPAIRLGNTLEGRSRGFDVSVTAQVLPPWRTHASYTHQRVRFDRPSDSRDVSALDLADPRHVVLTRQAFDLPRGIEGDIWVRHVSALPQPRVRGYTELDGRIGWRRGPTEIALIGNDLLHRRHQEFGEVPSQPRAEYLERDVRVTVTVSF